MRKRKKKKEKKEQKVKMYGVENFILFKPNNSCRN